MADSVDGDFVSVLMPWVLCVGEKVKVLTGGVYSHVPDNEAVGYQVFLRALHKYAKKEMRFGR